MTATTTPVRVLVVDDSAYIRKVVKEMLSRSPSLEVVGTARDSEEALELVERLKPDVVTCDLIMPGTDGVGFIQRSRRRRHRLRAEADGPRHREGLRCRRRIDRESDRSSWRLDARASASAAEARAGRHLDISEQV
jgi:CheY-like chemotaxis protein